MIVSAREAAEDGKPLKRDFAYGFQNGTLSKDRKNLLGVTWDKKLRYDRLCLEGT